MHVLLERMHVEGACCQKAIASIPSPFCVIRTQQSWLAGFSCHYTPNYDLATFDVGSYIAACGFDELAWTSRLGAAPRGRSSLRDMPSILCGYPHALSRASTIEQYRASEVASDNSSLVCTGGNTTEARLTRVNAVEVRLAEFAHAHAGAGE